MKKLAIILSVFIAVIFFLLYFNNQKVYMLEIVNPETDRLVFSRKVKPCDKFILESIHSLELSCITDEYKISHNYTIELISTTFSGHSAGLPFNKSKDEVFSVEKDGRFKISNRHIQMDKIPLRIQRNYGNKLVYDDIEINLSEIFDNTLLYIVIAKK